MSVDEKRIWQASITDFFCKRPLETGDEKKRVAKKMKIEPRLATLDWLRCVDNALRISTGAGFERYDSVSAVEAIESAATSANRSTHFVRPFNR
jgi:hypothetical protein